MEIRHLKLVSTVAETGSLTRAAEQLFLSQSALSHQLRELEEELNTQLFIRAKKQMLLTPTGKRLLKSARHILCELEKARIDIEHLNEEDAGTLRLTTACYTCYHWLSPVMKEFRKSFPNVKIEVHPEATPHPMEYLLEGKIDLVMTSDEIADPNLMYWPVFEDELIALVSPEHSWAEKSEVIPADFQSETLLIYDIPDQNSTVMTDFFKPSGFAPAKVLRFQLTEAVIEMAKAGMGIAILAEWAARPYIGRGELVGIPLGVPLQRTWNIVSLKNRQAPRYFEAFIDAIRQEVPENMVIR